MDKIEKYRTVLEDYLREQASHRIATVPDAKPHLIIDREQDEYLLMWIGWKGPRYIHNIMFHFQIIGDKVYIHQNNTDIHLGRVFAQAGIPRHDIVLSFISLHEREMAGPEYEYALA